MKDNMKLMFAFVIAAFAVIACAFIISDAGDSSADDSNGEFTFDSKTGTLTITVESKKGCMSDYVETSVTPWDDYKNTATSVVLGDNVTHIGNWAFHNFSKLESISISKNVSISERQENVGFCAFDGCTSLKTIIVREGNTSLVSVDNVLYSYDKKTLIQYPAAKEGGSYEVLSTVTKIINGAFDDCNNLKSISLPAGADPDFVRCFSRCANLTTITVAEGQVNYTSVDGSVITTKNSYVNAIALILCPPGKTGEYTVPDNVTVLYHYSLADSGKITSLVIPDSVVTIGIDAICEDNKALTKISFGTGLTSIYSMTGLNFAVGDTELEINAYNLKGKTFTLDNEVFKTAEDSFEAKIGNKYYNTLAEAVSAASADSTVTLLKNVELSSMLTISKKLTIDGGNFTLSASDSFADGKLINVPNANGDLTLKNITADANNKCRTVYCANGTLTVADGTKITGGKTANSYIGGVYMTGKSTFNMTGGEISGNSVSDRYKDDGYIQYSADLWIGSEAHGYISGGKAVNVFVNSNPSASLRAGLDQTGGEIGTVFVEWDGGKGEVGEFVYTGGTVTSIVMATNSDSGNHTYETKTPVKGTTYKMSAEASIGNVSYAYLKDAVEAANSAGSNVTINVLKNTTVSENMTINSNVTVAVGNNIELTVSGGKTLVVDGAVTLGTGSKLVLEQDAVLTGTVKGPASGSIENVLKASGLKAGSDKVTLIGGSLTINGTIVSKSTTVGDATITVSGDNITISGSLDESANVVIDGATTNVVLSEGFANKGTIEVKDAKVTLNNNISNSGTIEVKGNAAVTLNGSVECTETGVIELKDTAKIESSSSATSAKIENKGLIVDERTISAETPVVPLDTTASTGKVTAKVSSTVAKYVEEYTGIETTKYVTATIASIADQVYTGFAIKPAVITFKSADGTEVSLTEDTDYTVTYTGNTAVGTATVKVTPKGDTYGFTPVTASFTIYTDASTEGTIVTSGTSYTFTTGITTTGKLDIVLKEGTNEYTMTFAAGTVIPAGTVVSIEYVTSSMTASSINYEIKTTGYNGSFTVNVPCQEKFSKATVYCSSDPSVKVTDVKYNSKEGNVTFTADHNSTFVISLEKSSTVKVTDDGSSSDSGDYGVMIAFLMLAAAIGFLAVIIKRS